MAKRLPHKDVVVVGLGWAGSIIANELTDEGLDVVAIERGPWRDTAPISTSVSRRTNCAMCSSWS